MTTRASHAGAPCISRAGRSTACIRRWAMPSMAVTRSRTRAIPTSSAWRGACRGRRSRRPPSRWACRRYPSRCRSPWRPSVSRVRTRRRDAGWQPSAHWSRESKDEPRRQPSWRVCATQPALAARWRSPATGSRRSPRRGLPRCQVAGPPASSSWWRPGCTAPPSSWRRAPRAAMPPRLPAGCCGAAQPMSMRVDASAWGPRMPPATT